MAQNVEDILSESLKTTQFSIQLDLDESMKLFQVSKHYYYSLPKIRKRRKDFPRIIVC